MRHRLSILLITALIISCNSKKTKEEVKTTGLNDSITYTPPDTANHTINADSLPKQAGQESIGGLTPGMTATNILELMGQPDSRSKEEEWDADGFVHQDWLYRSKGITLNMASEKKGASPLLFSITVKSPSVLKTPENIGIGSDYKEVMTAYDKKVDREASIDNMIVVGSVYGGMIFSFKNNKVEKIFIGAAAE